VHFTNGVARFADNIFWAFASNGVPQNYWQNAVAQWVLTDPANSNLFVDPQLRSISRTNTPAFRLDPLPQPGSPALSSPRTAPNDGFYSPVAYRGAFADLNWASDWTFCGESGLLSGRNAGTPPPLPSAPPACAQPTLTIVRINDTTAQISWPSQVGCTYQLQVSPTLPAETWSNVGAPQSGTGGPLSATITTTSGNRFLRVRVQ
jgi:hypothetical protein